MKKIRFIAFLLLAVKVCFAQIQVTANNSATALAQKIVGNGITVLSASYKGHASAAGIFTTTGAGVGIDSGIILTSGRAIDASGNVAGTANFQPGTAGNSDLSVYSGNPTQNACVLDFDFIPQGDSINVKFVFASDEYPDYNCQTFNDVFGFFISGPGITGTKNIAMVPGTSIPVAINSINNGIASATDLPLCTSLGPGAPFTNLYVDNEKVASLTRNYIRYNGYTKVLLARAQVQPCQVYHITLAIADAIDEMYDSGVFIEAGSFSSNSITLSNEGGYLDNQNSQVVVEDCASSKVKLKLQKTFTSNIQVNLAYSGTATPGVDYQTMPGTVNFLPGETEKWLDIIPYVDNIPEGKESIVISVINLACSAPTVSSSLTVFIKDSIAFTQVKDTFVCAAFPTVLTARSEPSSSTNNWLWSSGQTTRQVSFTNPGTYIAINTFNNNCYHIDTFKIASGDPILTIGNNVTICGDDSTLITAVTNPAGGNLLWNTGSTALSFYIKTTGLFTATYTSPNGCVVSKSITSVVKPLPYPLLGSDTALCDYETLGINAFYPGATYLWNTGAATASITVKDPDTYIVTNTLNGCIVSDTIEVKRKQSPVAEAGANIGILQGGTAKLQAIKTVNNYSYLWQPGHYLSDSTVYNPLASPPVTTSYYLTVTSLDNCVARDTMVVTVKPYLLDIPNTFSPNGDGINDIWNIPMLSSYLKASVQVFNRNGQVV